MKERVLKLVYADIEKIKNHLATGVGVSDYAEYLKLIGKIQGLKCILEIYNQLESEDEQNLTGIIS